MIPEIDERNVNSLWGSVLVATLARLDLRHVVISPGSRSTPLTLVFARHPRIEAIPVLDERSAGFFALGLAKQHHRPVALLCTSGTAGANYFPAIIEAQEGGVPLLVITADRPPELRDCASGQTIDQQKLFGAHVNFYHELALPDAAPAMLAYLRQTVANAFQQSLCPRSGPVHLNAPFRDPLAPTPDAHPLPPSSLDESFFAHLTAVGPAVSRSLVWQRPTTARGLIVAGPAAVENPSAYAGHVAQLSAALGWPVLADGLSPLRARSFPGVVTMYDAILRDATLARDLTPRTVLCLGGWPTSKVLRTWLEASGAEILLVASSANNRDALHGKTRQIAAEVDALRVEGQAVDDPTYHRLWERAENAARSSLDRTLTVESTLFEGKAAWLVGRCVPEDTPVFVANSMPVRDVEYLWPARTRGATVHFNRGANGIDGTLSTALGVAHGRRGVLLTGDLALLHDANGFLSRPKFRGSLTIVLINNAGGGIFEHLPVAQFDPPFEDFFAMPQGVDFGKLCAAHGVAHERVTDWPRLEQRLGLLPESGIRVLEIRTDRKQDVARRKTLFAAAAAAARSIL